MDLETENRIAAILMKEAAELRQQADKEGVHAYLRQPSSRFRPNSRFLTATVLGVQQANRAVEVNEMWSARQKELNLDDRNKDRAGDRRSSGLRHGGSVNPEKNTSKRPYVEPTASGCDSGSCRSGYSSSKRAIQECYLSEDEGFKDDDIDKFLHSRVKRGRGAVGTRMDEPGPYLPTEDESSNTERWGRHKVILGPEKPRSLKFSNYDEEEALFQDKHKKGNKVGSNKRHSKSKEKSKDKKKKKKKKDEKISKRHS